MHRSPFGLLVLSCLAAPLAAQQPPTLDLMPVPRAVVPGQGRMRLDSSFSVGFTAFHDGRLDRAVTRMIGRLARRTALTLLPTPIRDSMASLTIIAGGA